MTTESKASESLSPARGRPYVTMHDTSQGFELFCFFPDRERPVINGRGEVLGYYVEVWPTGDDDFIPVNFVRDMTKSERRDAACNPWSFLNVMYPTDRDW